AGKLAASCDKTGNFILWDAATGKQLHRPGKWDNGPPYFENVLNFSPDGSLLTLHDLLWQTATGKEVQPELPNDLVYLGALTFGPNGKLLGLNVDDDERFSLWDLTSKKIISRLGKLDQNDYSPFALSPDAKVMTWWRPKNLVVWDVARSKER